MNKRELIVKKMKSLIKERFTTQKSFSEHLKIDKATVINWLHGKTLPNLETLLRISDYCNIDISYFFNDESNANIVDEKLFNKVFALAYDFAGENDIEISGSYFLGCYDLVVTMMHKDNIDYLSAFNNSKQLILKLARKS